MNLPSIAALRLPFIAFLSTLAIACSDSSDRNSGTTPPPVDPQEPEPELTYQADIVWTEYGIPHVTADDWGSLGYGSAYALAKENYCVLMKEYVAVNGETARYFGEDGDLEIDFVWKMFNSDERIQEMLDSLTENGLRQIEGYAAGLNRYLRDTGVDQLPEGKDGCRGAEWVREVDTMDVMRAVHKLVLLASGERLAPFIAAAGEPESVVVAAPIPDVGERLAGLDGAAVSEGLDLPERDEIGSNAYAIGADASQSGSGILYGNPHFPWQGSLRFFMSHMTMGDEYDVMGMSTYASPIQIIGFNQNLAWSHTVATGSRFTFYELQLNPENTMQYIYDGEIRDFEPMVVSTQNSSQETVERTFYLSHFGPVVDLGVVSPLLAGWPNAVGTLVVYRDANLGNTRLISQYQAMGGAENIPSFKKTLRDIGTPLLNTIAADRYGDAFYGTISVNAHVTEAQSNQCVVGRLQRLLTDNGFLTMDGSDSDCEWGNDEGAPKGVFGWDNLPKLDTREYVANANDSYWLANPRHLLEGYSPSLGAERVEQNMRPRHTFDQAERRLTGADNLGEAGFNIDNIRELGYQAENYVAQLVADDVVDICSETGDWPGYGGNADSMDQACEVLAQWDKAHRVDSVGAHLFWEFWQRFEPTKDKWSVLFDPASPISTPAVLSQASNVVDAVRQSLADAVAALDAAGIPLDQPWGEVQYDDKNGTRYGVHGGHGDMMFSNIQSELIEGEGYADIFHGNSYIQAVTWDESDCPDAYAILTYSQSTDPVSDHYADATKLYSEGGWIDMPFCEAARDEQEIGRATISE